MNVSWLFLCLWLSIEISCFVQTLSKQVDKTKLPKSGALSIHRFSLASGSIPAIDQLFDIPSQSLRQSLVAKARYLVPKLVVVSKIEIPFGGFPLHTGVPRYIGAAQTNFLSASAMFWRLPPK